MKIVIFPLGPYETNCYLIHNDKEAILFDVGGEPSSILDYLKKNALQLTHIFCTHLHFDHTYGVQALIDATGAKAFASEKDRFLLGEEEWGAPKITFREFTDLTPGEMTLLGMQCKTLPTPGHTPGGYSFYFPEASVVFVGDSLFYRSIGRTDFAGGNFDDLIKSIRTQLFTLPEDTAAYPGHGPHTTIGDEKRLNPYTGK